MPKWLFILIVVVIEASQSGCALFTDNPFQIDRILTIGPDDKRVKQMRKDFGLEPVNLESFKLEDDKEHTAYQRAIVDPIVRNRLQTRLMTVSDRVCDDHKAAVLGFRAQSNLALSIITTLTGVGGGIASGSAANALSGAAAGTNATRSAINEEIYQRLLVPTILRSVDQNRKQKEQEIIAKREYDGIPVKVEKYTVDEAVRDALNYHELCSFYQGVVTLTKGTERTMPTRTELRQQADDVRKRIEGYQKDLADLAASKEAEDAKKVRRGNIERTLQGLQTEIETLERMAGSVSDPGTSR